jgi:hypothetical protein
MAEGDGILYKGFKEALMKGIDFGSEKDTFRVVVHAPYHIAMANYFLAFIENPFMHEAVTETEVILHHERGPARF